MRRRGIVGIIGLLVVAVSCGGSGDDTGDPVGNEDPSAATDAVGSDDSPSTEPADEPVGDESAGDESAGDESSDGDTGSTLASDRPNDVGGSCDVAVSGDKQVAWSGGGTVGDVLVSYWLSDVEAEMIGDLLSIIINCVGEDGNSVSFVTGASATEENLPLAPGSFALTSAGVAEGDIFSVLVTLGDSETNWRVAAAGGTLDLTTLDDASIAGTFTIPMEDALAEITGTSEGTIVVTGSFDFPRPSAP